MRKRSKKVEQPAFNSKTKAGVNPNPAHYPPGMNERDESLGPIEACLEKYDQMYEWRLSQRYDGVLGKLPKWMSERDRYDFVRIRNELLDGGHAVELIITCMDMARDSGTEKEGPRNGVEFIPPEIYKEVAYLAHLREAVDLGPEVGLELLSGLDAVWGRDYRRIQSEKAKKPRGKINSEDDAPTVSGIIEALAIARKFQEYTAEELWSEFWSELESLGLHPKETTNHSDEKKSEYTYDVHDKRKRMTFGTFANSISKYRKSG
jgi:hypothetical protein